MLNLCVCLVSTALKQVKILVRGPSRAPRIFVLAITSRLGRDIATVIGAEYHGLAAYADQCNQCWAQKLSTD